MKRKFSIKRIIACALAIITAFTAIPLESTYAAEVTAVVSDDGSTLTISGVGEVPVVSTLVTDYSAITNVIIEEGITSIANNAFADWTQLSYVKLPSTLTTIGQYAFKNCTSLLDITIPKNVVTMSNSYNGSFRGSGLQSITFEEGMTKIPDYACVYINNLTVVNIPSTVTEIGQYAFYNCKTLATINLPSNLNKINSYAFNGCTSLTNITIPKSVTSADTIFGSSNNKLSTITFEDGATVVPDNICYKCTALNTVNIPATVTSIGKNAFYGCSSYSVVIPQNVTTIGSSAYQGCLIPAEITIPKNVISANKIFGSSNSKITTVTFEDGAIIVPENMCYGWTSLSTVNIPSTVTEIGNSAFQSCTGLLNISLHDNITKIGDNAFSSTKLTEIDLPNNLITLGQNVFNNTSIVNITIPKTLVNAINAFGHSPIQTITFEEGMTEIPKNICYNAQNLNNINFPNTLTVIHDGAFKYCTALTEITIPNSVISIGAQAFNECTSLTKITLPNNSNLRIDYYNGPSAVFRTSTTVDTIVNTTNKEMRKMNWLDWFNRNVTFIPDMFNITYTVDSVEYAYDMVVDGEVTTEPEEPTKEGYSFKGWKLNGSDYDFNSPVTADIELIGEFEINKYNVRYLDYDGTVISEQTVEHGSDAVVPTEPTRNGYEFTGWTRDNTNITANTDITAQYDKLKHTVIFKTSNSDVFETQTVEDGQTAVRPTTDPTKENGRFIDWYTDETYTTKFDFNTTITADTEVYAYFINQYTVTFMSSGEVVKTQSVEDGEYITEPEALEDRDMYSYNCRFVKWDYDFSQPITSDLTIYAEWEAYCNITVYNNIDNSSYIVEAPYNGTVDANDIPSAPAPRAGYTFVGYYKNFNQNVEFDYNEPINSHTIITETWKKNDIPAVVVNHFIHDEETNLSWGGNLTADSWLRFLGSECYSETLNETYTFDSLNSGDWNTTYLFEKDVFEDNLYDYMVLTKYDEDGNVASKELISTYQTDIYGNEILQIEVDFGEFGGRLDVYRGTETKTVRFAGYDVIYTNHDKENCNIDKCLCNVNFVNVTNIDGYEAATRHEELTGYRFTPCQHKTDFSHLDVFNFVDYRFIDDRPYYINKVTGQNESAESMPGYGKLIGWKTAKDASEMIDWNTVVFTDDTVLYPVIENYNCLKVTFVDSITNAVISEQYVNPYYGEGLIEPQSPTVPDGFVFTGWSETGSINDLFDLYNRPTTDITLYSVYQKSYLVEFLVEKEDGSLEQWKYQWVGENETVEEPTSPIKEGYDFLGWFDGDTKFDFNTQITNGLSLIGKWKIKELQVIYMKDDSVIGLKNVQYGQTVDEIEAPTKDGFDFIGWFIGNVKYDFNTPVKQDITLEAKYERHVHNFNIEVEHKESTCLEKGYEVTKCSCGEQIRTDFELDFTNHVGETETKGQKEATCTKDGYTGDKYCKSCNRVIKAGKNIKATGHDTKTVDKKEATCTTEGYTGDKVCKNCDSLVVKGTKIDKAPHVEGDAVKENYVEPTTESKGSYDLAVYCENCNTEISRKTEEIPMLELEQPEDTEDEEEPEPEEPGDPITDDEPLYVGDTDEETMSDIFGNFMEAVKTMAVVFSISLAAVTGVLGLLLLVLAWMKKVKVFNNRNTDMYSEDNYEVVLKTSVKTEGNKIAELFRKEDRVWTVIIPEETINNRVSNSFKVELNKFFCKRYNGEQLIIRLGSDENSRQIGFVIDEAENVVTFTYED